MTFQRQLLPMLGSKTSRQLQEFQVEMIECVAPVIKGPSLPGGIVPMIKFGPIRPAV